MTIDFGDVLGRLERILGSLLLGLPNLLFGILTFLAFCGVAWALGRAVRAIAARAGQPRGVQVVLARLMTWVVLALGILVAFTVVFPTITPASLFSALGVGGVAIGFAFKDIFQNLLAGVLILVTRPFRIGDQIVSADHEGEVEDIQVRATLLRTYDNRRVVIPNSELYTGRVTVNTAYAKRRLSVEVGIGYGEDIAAARGTILSTLRGLADFVHEPEPVVLVTSLGDFSVLLEVRFWIDPPARREAVETQDQVLEALKRALVEAGFDLPFPTHQVLLHDQSEDADGDRTRQREGWPEGA